MENKKKKKKRKIPKLIFCSACMKTITEEKHTYHFYGPSQEFEKHKENIVKQSETNFMAPIIFTSTEH